MISLVVLGVLALVSWLWGQDERMELSQAFLDALEQEEDERDD